MDDKKRNLMLGFLVGKVEGYIDEIHAASYPHTPYHTADMSYAYWVRVHECLRVMEASDSADSMVEDIKAMPESRNDKWIAMKEKERFVRDK